MLSLSCSLVRVPFEIWTRFFPNWGPGLGIASPGAAIWDHLSWMSLCTQCKWNGLPGHCAGPLSFRFASGSCQKKESRSWPCWHVCWERPPRSQGLQSSGLLAPCPNDFLIFKKERQQLWLPGRFFLIGFLRFFSKLVFLSSTRALIPFP